MRLRAPVAIGACVVALGSCGGTGPAIDAKGAELLQAEVVAARNATARGDGAEATEMLLTIDRTVDALRKQDKITESRANEVHAAVDEVRAALLRSAPAPTTTVPVTTSPETVAPAPAPAPSGPDVRGDDDDDRADDGDQKEGKGHEKREKRKGDD